MMREEGEELHEVATWGEKEEYHNYHASWIVGECCRWLIGPLESAVASWTATQGGSEEETS